MPSKTSTKTKAAGTSPKAKTVAKSKPRANAKAKVAQPEVAAYSNPIATSITGIKKMFRYNTGTVVALSLATIAFIGLLVLSIAAIIVSLFAVGFASEYKIDQFVPREFFTNSWFSYQPMLWVAGGLLVLLLTSSLMNALYIKLATVSVQKKHIAFGVLFRSALGRTLPLFGLYAITTLAFLAVIALVALAAFPLGPLTVVLGLIAFVATIYVSLRLSLAQFSVVEERLGVIASLKRSWDLTGQKVAEVVGVYFAAAILIIVPSQLLSALASNVVGPLSMVMELLSFVFALVAGIAFVAAFAERFEQLRAVAAGKLVSGVRKHFMNYLAPVIFIFAMMIIAPLDANNNFMNKNNKPASCQEGGDPSKCLDDLLKAKY